MLNANLVSRVSLEEWKQTRLARPLDGGAADPGGGGMSRRQFLRTASLAAGGALVSVPLLRRESQAVVPLLVFAAFGIFMLAKEMWNSNEVMSGRMQLVNRSNDAKEGGVSLKLINRINLDAVYQGMGRYEVPGRTVDTYEFSGPFSDRPGPFRLQGDTEIDSRSLQLMVA